MFDDPVVAETRRIREEYAARFGYDLAAIVADLQSRQGLDGRKVVRRSKKSGGERTVTSTRWLK